MSMDIPSTVNAADVTDWSDEVDVLVIGFGIAGGAAAVSAAAAGASGLRVGNLRAPAGGRLTGPGARRGRRGGRRRRSG